MDDNRNEFYKFLDEAKERTKKEADALVEACKADEARAYKAKLNIYDIFATLMKTAETKSKGDASLLKKEFSLLAERIPRNWYASLEEARAHGDFEKVMIEEAKISASEEITAKFRELF